MGDTIRIHSDYKFYICDLILKNKMKMFNIMNVTRKPFTKNLFLSFVLALSAVMPIRVAAGNFVEMNLVEPSPWGCYYYADPQYVGGEALRSMSFTINDGLDLSSQDGNYSLHIPFSNTHANYYCRSQMIIPATTLYGSGTLADLDGTTWSQIEFYRHTGYTNYAIVSGLSYDVYLSETPDSYYDLGGTTASVLDAAFKDYSSATLVYSGSISLTNNKVVLSFSEPFEYNGGNILLTIAQTSKSTSTQANRYAVEKGMAHYQSIFLNYNNSTFTSTPSNPEAIKGLPMMTVTYDYIKAKTPVFTPDAGSYNASFNVAISCATNGATIHYTTNGSDPTTSSPVYTSPLSITTTTTLKAMAVKEGLNNSLVNTAEYELRPGKPTFNPGGGAYTSVQTVTITPPVCEHPVTVHYTLDGSMPTEESPVYTTPITISGAEAQNYDIGYVAGMLTIIEADPIKIIANNLTMEYGDDVPSLTFTTEGAALVGTPELTCEATANSPVGEYPIIIKKGNVENYNDTYVNGVLTITKAPLKASVGNYSREQGQENPDFTISYSGWKNNENESVLLKKPVATTEATKDSAAGKYAITISGGEAQNYAFEYANGTLTVTVPSGIEALLASGQPFDVYTTTGIKVRSQVTSLKGLARGVYIINKMKVFVK